MPDFTRCHDKPTIISSPVSQTTTPPYPCNEASTKRSAVFPFFSLGIISLSNILHHKYPPVQIISNSSEVFQCKPVPPWGNTRDCTCMKKATTQRFQLRSSQRRKASGTKLPLNLGTQSHSFLLM